MFELFICHKYFNVFFVTFHFLFLPVTHLVQGVAIFFSCLFLAVVFFLLFFFVFYYYYFFLLLLFFFFTVIKVTKPYKIYSKS